MAPSRRRRTRLIAALSAALVLAGALAYTSFSTAAQVRSPSQLASATSGHSYQVTGKVLPGYTRDGTVLAFRLTDRSGSDRRTAIAVRYTGEVPDPFKAGREVIVTVERSGNGFIGQKDSLTTKCPSKFASAPSGSTASGAGQ
jgi:cytochrome c-type biogenesis protein CcmE